MAQRLQRPDPHGGGRRTEEPNADQGVSLDDGAHQAHPDDECGRMRQWREHHQHQPRLAFLLCELSHPELQCRIVSKVILCYIVSGY